MPTFRVRHDRNYFCLSREAAQDSTLSFRARGLHHFLLSFPDDWVFNEAHIIKSTTEGRDAVRAAIGELVKAGYLVKNQYRGDNGRFGGAQYDVRETRQPVNGISGDGDTVYGETVDGKSVDGKTVDGKSDPILSNDLLPSNKPLPSIYLPSGASQNTHTQPFGKLPQPWVSRDPETQQEVTDPKFRAWLQKAWNCEPINVTQYLRKAARDPIKHGDALACWEEYQSQQIQAVQKGDVATDYDWTRDPDYEQFRREFDELGPVDFIYTNKDPSTWPRKARFVDWMCQTQGAA